MYLAWGANIKYRKDDILADITSYGLIIRNTKIVIWPVLLGGGSFPSYWVRKALLKVRITFITGTGAAALRYGYKSSLQILSLTPPEWQSFYGLGNKLVIITTDNIKQRDYLKIYLMSFYLDNQPKATSWRLYLLVETINLKKQ